MRATSTVSASETRRPSWKRTSRPSRSMYWVISGPPPWTMIGFSPTYLSRTTSVAKASRRSSSRIAAPPYLITTVRPWNSLDVGQRLEQRVDVHSGRPRLGACSVICSSFSCRVLRVDPHVLVAEVREPDVGAVLAAVEPQADLGLSASSPASSAASIDSAPISSRSSPASAMPAAWAIRPQLGSRPNSAVLTRGELAIARATRSASAGEAAPSTWILPIRTAPSPSATISSASCSRTASSRPSGSGARAAPVACSEHGVVGAHLPVDGDPLEGGVDRGAQGRVGILDDRVGLDEAEHRREARLDHPGALRLGGEGDAAGAQRAALRPAVGGEDRVGEGDGAVAERGRPRPRRSRPAPRRSAAARRSPRSRRRRPSPAAVPAARPPRRTSRPRRRSPARPSRRWRCRR